MENDLHGEITTVRLGLCWLSMQLLCCMLAAMTHILCIWASEMAMDKKTMWLILLALKLF